MDVAFKVGGTGCVGTRDYVVLCFGNGSEDPLFLQMKEEPHSAYAEYLEAEIPRNQGERVVRGQRLMQAQSYIFLGWTRMNGRDYLVRQLTDFQAAISTEDLKGCALAEYAKMCGEVLGKGHGVRVMPACWTAIVGTPKNSTMAWLNSPSAMPTRLRPITSCSPAL